MTFDFKKGPKGDTGATGATGEPGAPGSSAWADLTGSPSDNADLQTALGLRLLASNNLSDLGSASAARTNLGLGTLATQNGTISNYLTIANAASTYLTIANAASNYAPLVHSQAWATITGAPVVAVAGMFVGGGSAGSLSMSGGNGDGSASGGNAGTINLGGDAAAAGLAGGNGGSILAYGNGIYNAGSIITASPGTNDGGSIDTQAGGSLTMGTGSLTGPATSGEIMLTTGSGAAITNLNASNISSGSLALARIAQAGATTGQAIAWNGSAWAPATVAASGATLAANTFTGLQQFSGTTHAGLRLNNLTTVQRDAIASPSAGMAIWNTTASRLQLHNGSGWTAGMVRIDGDTMTGALINSTNGALSSPALRLTGNYVTGGTGITNVPLFLIEPTGTTAATTWATTGTILGINIAAPSGTERMIDCRLAGGSVFSVDRNGSVISNFNISATGFISSASQLVVGGAFQASGSGVSLGSAAGISWSSTANYFSTNDLFLSRAAAASLQLGANHATTAINQTIKAHNVTTGTGSKLCLGGGTGSVAGGAVSLATSATNGALVEHLLVRSDGVIDFASASLTTESVTSNRTLTIRVGGTLVKLLAFV